MTHFKFFLFLFGVCASSTNFDAASYGDRECGTDLSNLWLDVVIVVDNSIGMTKDGLASISANIVSVFDMGTQIGSNSNNPKTTRVGLITYNALAYQNADLNQIQSLDALYNLIFTDLKNVSSSDESLLSNGLAMASNLLAMQSSGPPRGHYKKVVIVYASTYKDAGSQTPIQVAERMKTSGIVIITVAFDQDGDGELLKQLKKIASPGYNFANTDFDGNLLGEIQGALIEINCYCPNNWIQYRQNFSDPTSYSYGVCIQPVGMAASWRSAKMSCGNRWKNSYMVNEYNQQKHDFVLESIKGITGFLEPYSYHIGLSLVTGKWRWDQPTGWVQPVLQTWYNWLQDYPIASSSLTVALNIQNNQEVATGWQNTDALTTGANYVCEVASCDTDNYCTVDGY